MDELTLELDLPVEQNTESAKKAQKKKQAAKYVPTEYEQWVIGWDVNGKHKPGIFQMSITDSDRTRLQGVRMALETGEIQRSADKAGKPMTKSEALSLYPLLMQSRIERILADMVANKPPNYHIITEKADFDAFLTQLWAESIVALDTETNGLDCHGESRIVGISVTLPSIDQHFYIPFGHREGSQLSEHYVLGRLKDWFESWRVRKVLHNSKFDAHMLFRHGIRLRGIHADTMIRQKILNENEESVALKNLANKYGKLFGYESDSYTYEDLFGKDRPFDDVDFVVGGIYAAKDTHLTWLLYVWQQEHFDRLPGLDFIYREIENPLIDVCITMEQTGFLIDLEYSSEFGRQLKDEIADLLSRMRSAFGVGDEFNFDSPAQLADLLYRKLRLPDKKQGSVDAKALKFMQREHEGIPLILEYRAKTKLVGTYVEALPAKVKRDGRIRGQFNQVATVTGRFSSNDPNLQNLPPNGKRLIVSPDGWIIIGSDFSQIEPRVLAHISGDKELQQIYKDGKDLYSSMAAKVFDVPIEDCGDGSKYRKAMKTIILAIMYGLSAFSLGETLKMKTEEAEQLIRDFYTAYPDVYRWIRSVWEQVKQQEYVETLYGRKRRFPGHKEQAILFDQASAAICQILEVDELPSSVWQYRSVIPYDIYKQYNDNRSDVLRTRRMAVNAIIQGTAADIMKLALIALHEYTEAHGWAINGTVHDEALSQVPESISLAEVEEMESLMTGVVKLDVPLKCDTEIFKRWGDGISKKEWFANAA